MLKKSLNQTTFCDLNNQREQLKNNIEAQIKGRWFIETLRLRVKFENQIKT